MFGVTFVAYFYLLKTGATGNLATSVAFTTLILANVLVVYVLQSDDYAIKNFIVDLKDKVIVIINSVIIGVLMLLIYVPFLNRLVGMAPLDAIELLAALSLALLSTFVFDLLKKPRGRRKLNSKPKTK